MRNILSIQLIFIVFFFLSCAGSSEVIIKSSRNQKKGATTFTVSGALNPTIMPLNYEVVDTISNTGERNYGNYPNPNNPIVSIQANRALTNFYEVGIGVDGSLLGYSLNLNNKLGFSDIINAEKRKMFGLSYYNKSSFTQGITLFGSSYLPTRPGHFEIGNYLVFGIFFKKAEIVIIPHFDYNYLKSNETEEYYISDNNVIENILGDVPDSEIRVAKITNSTISFINYGINLAYRTNNDYFIEIGMQYVSSNQLFFEPQRKSYYQFCFGIGKSLTFQKLKKRYYDKPDFRITI